MQNHDGTISVNSSPDKGIRIYTEISLNVLSGHSRGSKIVSLKIFNPYVHYKNVYI